MLRGVPSETETIFLVTYSGRTTWGRLGRHWSRKADMGSMEALFRTVTPVHLHHMNPASFSREVELAVRPVERRHPDIVLCVVDGSWFDKMHARFMIWVLLSGVMSQRQPQRSNSIALGNAKTAQNIPVEKTPC